MMEYTHGRCNSPTTSFDISVLPFESDNTLKLEWQTLETTFFISVSFKVYSSKPIASITPDF